MLGVSRLNFKCFESALAGCSHVSGLVAIHFRHWLHFVDLAPIMICMADINIENFYTHVAKILSILYANFPTKIDLYVDHIGGIDEPDEYGLHSPNYTAGFYAILWLQEEGYLRFNDVIRQDGVDQATLTHRAFMGLTSISEPIYLEPEVADHDLDRPVDTKTKRLGDRDLSPSVQEDNKLIIRQLRVALNDHSSIAIKKIVQHFLSGNS